MQQKKILDRHAPRLISTATGVVVGLAAMAGVNLSEGQEGLLEYAIALAVPPVLAYIGGVVTEGYTYARETVEDITKQGRD